MKRTLMIAIVGCLFPAVALAQSAPPPQGPDVDGDGADEDVTKPADNTSAPNDGTPLPESESDDDAAPPVATPGVPPGGFVSQAGIGGQVGYGRAGVLELGGSAGFRIGDGFSTVNVAPSIGWFVADNLQVSAILDIASVSAGDEDATVVTALAEPSYHLPFTRGIFGFLGVGLGGSYVSDLGGGFAMAPRLGANFTVGRSGLLTPSVSWQYTTQDIDMEGEDAANDITVVAVSSAVRLNIGYTVMW
jgi:hypothetical protein